MLAELKESGQKLLGDNGRSWLMTDQPRTEHHAKHTYLLVGSLGVLSTLLGGLNLGRLLGKALRGC
jgi:hypothetical protein